jgi:hypothetical protein
MATVERAPAETGRNRRRLVADAGYGTTSLAAVVAGALVALGAVALLLALTGAVGSQLGLRTTGISTDRWRQAGTGGAIVAALVLFACFWFGGYTSGRMSRRAGARHGLFVFLLAVIAAGVVAVLAATLGDPASLTDDLHSNGVPTDGATWSDIGLLAAILAVAAAGIGSVLGGIQGDRWHGKLLTTAVANRRRELEAGAERAVVEDHAARRHWYERRGHDVPRDDGGDAVDLRDRPSLEAERADHAVDR